MQFIKNGPDIPERLLQAHEDGKVVFFCGAGISYPAGLPGFEGLVRELYSGLGVRENEVERAAIKRMQYDTAIGLLEGRVIGKRETVRQKLAEILTPDSSILDATKMHKVILTLAQNRERSLRLVTTNFDRLFQKALEQKGLSVPTFQAPLLPVPKNRWHGLVYLHGLLPDEPNRENLDRLVLSSGDFGLAYLTDAWAARFVGELFRNFTVCFVGYSINDPVLRYMTDALAADKLLGESPSEMFAFGNYSRGKEAEQEREWRAKNVTPILYRQYHRHFYLQKTLRVWSEMYRDGVQGKEQVVVRFAGVNPASNSKSDNLVGRMLWALSDPSGRPARRFAEIDPVPSIDWLESLSENSYKHTDLSLFGIAPMGNIDAELYFSLIHRPTPYRLAPAMALASPDSSGRLDRVMHSLGIWLTRHLNDPKLVLWIAEHGGKVHYQFGQLIERKIAQIEDLEEEDNHQELSSTLRAAPNSVPSHFMRTLWRLLLKGRLKSRGDRDSLFRWSDRFSRDGLTLSLRLELRESLKPCVLIRKRISWPTYDGTTLQWEQRVDWEVIPSAEHLHAVLHDLYTESKWVEKLPDLLSDFNLLLHDTLDLMRELMGVEHRQVFSSIAQPSISEHSQNERFFEWTVLIDLTREAWIAMAKLYPKRANIVAETWVWMPYPLFKRLALFAATYNEVVPADQALNWLLHDENWWLWSIETQRETIRLLAVLAPRLDSAASLELERAILRGPPPDTHDNSDEQDGGKRFFDYDIWLRLAKMKETGTELGEAAQSKLDELSQQYPSWQLAIDQKDEFATWMEHRDVSREFVPAPLKQDELEEWLRQHVSITWDVNAWQQRCREDFPTVTAALTALALEGVWPSEHWKTALLSWTDEESLRPSWHKLAQFFAESPDDFVGEIAHELILWLMEQAKQFVGQEELFFGLLDRILDLELQGSGRNGEDLVNQALYHPIGRVTETLMRWWRRHPLQDGDGLQGRFQTFLERLCDTENERFRHGRVIMATHLITLYRVDEIWTTENLLPQLDWQHSHAEAQATWQGFLWSHRLYWKLMEAIKEQFLNTAGHFTELGKYGENYASLLTFVALDRGDLFSKKELADATHKLSPEGLSFVAESLVRALSGAGEQRVEYWKNRILPYLDSIWPNAIEVATPEIIESLARLCIAAGDAFPEATRRLNHWLRHPVDDPQRTRRANRVIHELDEARLSMCFPDEALLLLDSLRLRRDEAWLVSDHLAKCLDEIRIGNPNLKTDPRIQKLETLCQDQ